MHKQNILRRDLFMAMLLPLSAITACTSTPPGPQSANVEDTPQTGKLKPYVDNLVHRTTHERSQQGDSYLSFLAAERLSLQNELESATILYQSVYDESPNLTVGLKLARNLAIAGRTTDAENVVRKVKLLFPDDYQPKLAEAYLAQARGAPEESLEILKEAYSAHPQSEEVAARYIDALAARKDEQGVERVLNEAAVNIPQSSYFLLQLARRRFDEKKFSKAKAHLDALLRVDPDNIEAWTLAGFIAVEEEKTQEAESYFKHAYDKQPENDVLAKYYISQLLKLEKLAPAQRLLSKIVDSAEDPKKVDPDLRFQLAVVLFQLEEFESARERFLQLAKDSEEPGRMLYYAGQCNERMKQYEAALAIYEKVTDESSFYSAALERRIVSHLDLNQKTEARMLMREYQSSAEETENYYRFSASVFARFKEPQKALEMIRKSPVEYRKTPEFKYLEAIYIDQAVSREASLTALKKLIVTHPDFAPALNHLGYTLVEMNQELDLATELLIQVIELEPENGYYLDSLGWAYFKKGQLDLAEEYLLKALQIAPNEPVILEHLAELKMKQNRLDMALKYYQRAMDLFNEAPMWKFEADQEWRESKERVTLRLKELIEFAKPTE